MTTNEKESPIEQLDRLATRLDSNAVVSMRPGQMADLESIAADLRAVVNRLKSWEGITALLNDRAETETWLRNEIAEKNAAIHQLEDTLDGYRYTYPTE